MRSELDVILQVHRPFFQTESILRLRPRYWDIRNSPIHPICPGRINFESSVIKSGKRPSLGKKSVSFRSFRCRRLSFSTPDFGLGSRYIRKKAASVAGYPWALSPSSVAIFLSLIDSSDESWPNLLRNKSICLLADAFPLSRKHVFTRPSSGPWNFFETSFQEYEALLYLSRNIFYLRLYWLPWKAIQYVLQIYL